MSIREGKFCDFKTRLIDTQDVETGDTCANPAVGTCALCKTDYCAVHSSSDKPLSGISIRRRTPGSGQLHTTAVVEEDGEMCQTCTKAFENNGDFKLVAVRAARDAAVKALAAMQVEQALAEPRKP